jgi:hypothetical protein
MRTRAAALGIMLALAIPVAPSAHGSGGPTATSSACGSIKLGGRYYVFYKGGLKCAKAKRLARYVHRTHKRPDPRWRCTSGSGFTTGGNCTRRDGRHFGWHPAD